MKVTGRDPAKTAELNLTKGKEPVKDAPKGQDQEPRETAQARTRASLTMDKVREAIRQEPDVRADKVEALKSRIKSGQYKVDTDALAGKILSESIDEDLDRS